MTTTDVATTTNAALALRPDQTTFSDEQVAVLRHMGIPERTTTADLQVFLHRCQTLKLDPFAGQIHLVEYGGKPVIQVGIHGWESIAQDAADAAGVSFEWEDPQWCGPDGVWRDVWLDPTPPAAARAVVLRDGKRFPAVCVFAEFVGQKKVYRNKQWTGEWEINAMWSGKPAHMIGKCARAAALRSAFPRQFSDVRIPEELAERPAMVHGEVVREDRPAGQTLAHWMEAVAAATTRAELEHIWREGEPQLGVADRAALLHACQAAAADLAAIAEQEADETGQLVEP